MSFYRPKLVKTALATVAALLMGTSANAADHVVEINKTSVLRLSRPASAVVIGNPKIADISVHSSDTLLLSGRGFGTTNILAFDEFGQTIMDSEIQVNAPQSASAVRVNNVGEGYRTFSCNPHCLPAPILGDTRKFISDFEGKNVQSTTTTATGPLSSSIQSSQNFTPPAPELQR
ncbi:MAG: hypothetical protein EX271_01940 [Acidimicrobiales bacterium]|nr:hypothetical protein [Hyphomonadaceae bacterium]RZV44360.1 MAG: hypothetical protein EX271_01940 [Acidimicrobiales bacterium]